MKKIFYELPKNSKLISIIELKWNSTCKFFTTEIQVALHQRRVTDEKRESIYKKSDARVNLPHIGNRKCIKLVLHRNLHKMQRSTFLSRNLNGKYLLKIKTLSFSFILGRQNSYNNWHYICHTVKFA
jgi:hypothetical protein